MSMILIHNRLMILYMTLLMTFLLCHWNKTNVHRPIPDESHLQLHDLALISTTLIMMPALKRTLRIMHQHMKQSQVLKLKSTQLTWCSAQDLCLFIIYTVWSQCHAEKPELPYTHLPAIELGHY